ncbi:hypothetical protein AB0E63_22355 [Kribbella sp. NPDC026596]
MSPRILSLMRSRHHDLGEERVREHLRVVAGDREYDDLQGRHGHG